jgi:predicted O-methyltransferase YrrM
VRILNALRGRVTHGLPMLVLPRAVRRFYWRAWRLRTRIDDDFSLGGATKPRELRPLLRAAGDAALAVEVGTGTGWTAIALALAQPGRRVLSFDPVVRAVRDDYLALAGPDVAARVTFVEGLGEDVPGDVDGVDFLFIDAAHDYESTRGAFEAWRPRLAPGAVVAFHDFDDPQWPGVTQAIRELGLRGTAHHHLFVWRG